MYSAIGTYQCWQPSSMNTLVVLGQYCCYSHKFGSYLQALLLKVTKLLLLPVSQYANPLYAQGSIVTVGTVLVVYAQC